MILPERLEAARAALRNGDPWWARNVHEGRTEQDCWATALGRVVAAFGPCELDNAAHRRLVRLALFAARRALPCWDLYCDTDLPHRAVQAVQDWLTDGREAEHWQELSEAALPSFEGRRIRDCRECDTGSAAGAAAAAVRLVVTGQAIQAAYAVSKADSAFDQSPIHQSGMTTISAAGCWRSPSRRPMKSER